MKKIALIIFTSILVQLNAQVSDFKDINFIKANNLAKLQEGKCLKNLPLLATKLTSLLTTDVEKFRAIYTWVCTNIKGDYTQHSTIRRKRKKLRKDTIALKKWNKKYKKKAFKKLLAHKKTMCTGYAYLIKELAFLADIECEIIDGYGRSVDSNLHTLNDLNHSWNAVKLNNKWYLCDATWSSGYMDSNYNFIKEYNDGYFLTDPALFEKNHYPLNPKWLLSATSKEYFINAPLLYNEAFKYKISAVSPSKMEVTVLKNTVTDFQFNFLNTAISKNKFSLVYYTNGIEKNIPIYDMQFKNNILMFKYKFNRKGNYDVHLKVNNDIVITYNIDVINS